MGVYRFDICHLVPCRRRNECGSTAIVCANSVWTLRTGNSIFSASKTNRARNPFQRQHHCTSITLQKEALKRETHPKNRVHPGSTAPAFGDVVIPHVCKCADGGAHHHITVFYDGSLGAVCIFHPLLAVSGSAFANPSTWKCFAWVCT